jgi:hypothetical protein
MMLIGRTLNFNRKWCSLTLAMNTVLKLPASDLVVILDIHTDDLCSSIVAGYVWTLVFSTSQHGFSLNSLYRKMNRLESPILMVIEDTEHNVSAA